MEEQKVQSVPEVIDGEMPEETETSTQDAEVNNEEVTKKEDDEEFYERIEAPKFVDFTKPYTFRTDDRYWFCSRVGCDQKHEEEINPEEISKNFVLRVLAARSPNIKLRKALNGDRSGIKCPLSAPAKPSKPRIPRLAIVSSSVSQKIGDPQNNIRPLSKMGSTPVAKSREVAAKYMTTPKNKQPPPNSNSFRSVQNPKTSTVDVHKNRIVAKALVFHSPKKVISLKKSVELHTPLRKICEGMKRLEIASQKKTPTCTKKSKPMKPETEDSSRKQKQIHKGIENSKELVPSKTAISPNKKKEDLQSQGSFDVDVKLSDDSTSDFTKKEDDLHPKETSITTDSHALITEMNSLSNLDDKENMGIAEDHSIEVDDDCKQNTLNLEDNNRFNNQPLGDQILAKETHKKKKVVQSLDKHGDPVVMKYKKPKPTCIKPFRLRTDERGILKEATLERKLHLPITEKDAVKDSSVVKRKYQIQKNEKFTTEQSKDNGSVKDNRGKESGGVGSKPVSKTARKLPKSTQLRTRSPYLQRQPQGVASPRKLRRAGPQLGVIKEKSSKLTSDVMVAENNTNRSTSAARSTSRGKRPATIAKEPNFHRLHMPRSCTQKTA